MAAPRHRATVEGYNIQNKIQNTYPSFHYQIARKQYNGARATKQGCDITATFLLKDLGTFCNSKRNVHRFTLDLPCLRIILVEIYLKILDAEVL